MAYIGPKSRTEEDSNWHRGSSDTTRKVKGSKVNLQEARAYCGGLPHNLLLLLLLVVVVVVVVVVVIVDVFGLNYC